MTARLIFLGRKVITPATTGPALAKAARKSDITTGMAAATHLGVPHMLREGAARRISQAPAAPGSFIASLRTKQNVGYWGQ